MKRNEVISAKAGGRAGGSLMGRGFKYLALLAMALMVVSVTHAQVSQDAPAPDEGSTNDGPTGPGGGPGDPDVPIDGGISLLIAAGIGYGIKRKHDINKKSEKE